MNPVLDLEVYPFPSGGGVSINWLNPTSSDYDHVRVLRVEGAGPIAGPMDPSATVLLVGTGDAVEEYRSTFLPAPALVPGQARRLLDSNTHPRKTYTYAVFAANAAETDISDGVSRTVVAQDIAILYEADLIDTLITYLRLGLSRALESGVLKIPKKIADQVSELTVVEGPPRIDAVTFPCVSIQLDDDSPADFFIGDAVDAVNQEDGESAYGVGYFSLQSISIAGWAADNPEVRRSLYRTIKGLLIASRQFLGEAGIKTEFSGSFKQDFNTYEFPMYYGEFRLRAWVLSRVLTQTGPDISEIDVVNVTI